MPTQSEQQRRKAVDEFAKIHEQIDREVNARILQVLLNILKSEEFKPSKGKHAHAIATRIGIKAFLAIENPEREVLYERLGAVMRMLRMKLLFEGLHDEKYESWQQLVSSGLRPPHFD